MPLIHKGDSAHHQDQVITPVSFSTMNAGSERTHRSWPRFQIHTPTDPGRLNRKVATPPLSHKGDSTTHHQDQSITPVSLSTMSAGSERAHRPLPQFQIHAATDPGRLNRKVTFTAPA